MELLLTVLGVVLILEGIPWFLSPSTIKKVYAQMLILPERHLRFMGLSAMLGGLLLVYLIRG
ncbi:MAG: DUF2065 domain-containing protein [Desulfuromonadaceae bacterium]|nr:DUF2065 domain-containing protein [Desulfuromonadaceae bacterium]